MTFLQQIQIMYQMTVQGDIPDILLMYLLGSQLRIYTSTDQAHSQDACMPPYTQFYYHQGTNSCMFYYYYYLLILLRLPLFDITCAKIRFYGEFTGTIIRTVHRLSLLWKLMTNTVVLRSCIYSTWIIILPIMKVFLE